MIAAVAFTQTVEELMEMAVRVSAFRGRWDQVSLAGKRLMDVRFRRPGQTGKKQQRQDAADALSSGPSRFAPRPPPPKPN